MAVALAGCSAETDVVGAAKASTAERGPFPLSGSWTWADGGRLLPARNVGCREKQSKLSPKPWALEIEVGAWRHAAFAVIDWSMSGPDELQLRLEDNTSGGRRRLLVRLDLSHAGFVRFVGATDERGRPLDGWRDHRTGREITGDEERAALAGAFTWIRCADESVDVAALLKGPAASEPRQRVIR